MLRTKYNVGDIPHSEYPRPQFERESYLCLNGLWDFGISKSIDEIILDKKIKVPFSPETINSGIQPYIVKPEDVIHYKRRFVVDESWLIGHSILHFGAVDYSCKIYVNSNYVGYHNGGYTSFAFDITPYLRSGENEIYLSVNDTTINRGGGRGKQSLKPGGIWYTSQSGIWQTVWMENLPLNYISSIDYYPDLSNGVMRVVFGATGLKQYSVYDDGELIIQGETEESEILLKHNFIYWTPENPKLYDFVVSCGQDKVKSYFAMRSFGIGCDKKGKKRLLLNNKPYFFNGLLDQGYWPDGLLTYPSDEAILDELRLIKSMGYNTLRKHIKVEPMRWYYHCDKIGFVVWQDFVNGGGEYSFNHIATFPFLGFKHRDDDYAYFSRVDDEGRRQFVHEWQETVSQLKNCVCISMWTIFNEGWGQFESQKNAIGVEVMDDTRVIESVSGWHDYNNQCLIRSLHTYYTPLKVPKDNRPVTLSEFGGYSLKISNHVFNENKLFGYKKFKDKESFESALKKLYLSKLLPLISKGLCGAIYTQVSDVEEEINGLVTYDREVVKISPEVMKEINNALYDEFYKVV